MDASKYKSKKYIRLFIIIIYLLFMTPLQFSFEPNKMNNIFNIILKTTIIISFVIFELIEYYNNYDSKKKKLNTFLFIIRVLAIIITFLFEYRNKNNIDPFYVNIIPLLVFYSFFIFPPKLSLSTLIFFCGLNFIYNDKNLALNQFPIYYSWLLKLQRIIINFIFYLFAKFWQSDLSNTIERDKLVLELNQSKNELKEYANEISKITILEERTRIAREMHDNIGHSLTAIQIQLRKALAFIKKDEDESKKSIEAALEVSASSLKDTRAVLNDLSKSNADFNLKEKINSVLSILMQSGIEVESNIEEQNSEFNYSSLLALFRFSQECSTNIIKHSNATKVKFSLKYKKQFALIEIEDNGIGFNYNKLKTDNNSGMGIKGLIERFELIHGSLNIKSSENKGTIITAYAPKDPVKLIGENNE